MAIVPSAVGWSPMIHDMGAQPPSKASVDQLLEIANNGGQISYWNDRFQYF